MCQHRPVSNAPGAAPSEHVTTDGIERPQGRQGVVAVAALALIAMSCLGGIAWGQRHPVVHVDETTCLALESQIGCTLPDGWDIGVAVDVSWTDAAGVFHEGGRPECLPPTGRGASEPVHLHWLRTATGDRYVVEVTCQAVEER